MKKAPNMTRQTKYTDVAAPIAMITFRYTFSQKSRVTTWRTAMHAHPKLSKLVYPESGLSPTLRHTEGWYPHCDELVGHWKALVMLPQIWVSPLSWLT